uniref:Ig-like domain-containing protein n=1 Tax=Taeniopygia guttata TaxID=59729 RepID=A0A674GS83_TAEGU|nr:natural killer cell receptor 2B4 isoform X3 [Taeniopygia guttata]
MGMGIEPVWDNGRGEIWDEEWTQNQSGMVGRERKSWEGGGERAPSGPEVAPAVTRFPLEPRSLSWGHSLRRGSGSGSPECQNRAVAAGGSLCLVPDKPLRNWISIQWKVEINSSTLQQILTATRDGTVSHPRGPFHGRAKFHQGNLSLCISPAHGADNGVYRAEFESSSRILSRCFRVSVWEPVAQPELKSQILQRGRGWCRLALLCSSPGNVSYSWACPGAPPGEGPGPLPGPGPDPIPGIPSRLVRRLPEGAEPQICLCNVSGPAGWSAARAPLTCPAIPDDFGHWTLLAVVVAVAVGLTLLLVGGCCWWRKRRKNSREETPGTPPGPPEQELTVYAEVGENKPRQDPAGPGEATQEGATVYAVVSPRTLEHPRHREEPGNSTVYSMVQFSRRPSSIKRKRLDPALVSTAYLEDNGGYRRLGFPNPAGHQRP